jgi:hypothetical protein
LQVLQSSRLEWIESKDSESSVRGERDDQTGLMLIDLEEDILRLEPVEAAVG